MGNPVKMITGIFKKPKLPPPPPMPTMSEREIAAEEEKTAELERLKDKEEETKTARLAGLYGRRSLISGQSGSMAGFRRSLFGATDSSALG